MNTIQEYNNYIESIESEINNLKSADSKTFIESLEKVIKIGRQVVIVLSILAKYFYKDGKIFMPSLFKFWIFVPMIRELYIFFRNINKE